MPDWLAVDYSYAHPSGQELADAGVKVAIAYTGSGKPRPGADYIADMNAHGVGFCFVQESYATRGFEGYSAGFVDAQYAAGRASEVGYPEGCCIYVALADTSNVAGHEQGIAQYAAGFRDGLGAFNGPKYRPGGYGPKAAIDAAWGSLDFRWGVWTWGYGYGMCPIPAPGDCHLYQDANRAAPLPDTDADVMSTAYVGQQGGSAAPAPPEKPKEYMMWIALFLGLDNAVHAYCVAGATIMFEFGGPPTQPYGIPQEAVDSGLHMERVDTRAFQGISSLDRLDKASAASLVMPNTSGGGGNPDKPISAFTDEELDTEVEARVARGDMTLKGVLKP